MNRIIVLGIILFGFVASFISCSSSDSVTLESMKTTLMEAGYKIADGSWDDMEINILDEFIFIYPAGALDVDMGLGVPVLEFKDEASANDYIKSIDDEIYISAIHGKFVTIALITGSLQKDFLEKLVNGKSITE